MEELPTPSDYVWSVGVEAQPDDFDSNDHVGNAAIARLLDEARAAWFRSLARADGRETVALVRALSIVFDREARPGVDLRCGVRAVARGSKSLTLDQTLWRADDGTPLVRATAVHVCFEPETRATVAIWPALLDAIEQRQGEPLPEAARPSSR